MISDKIKKQINDLDVSESLKELMLKILEIEDKGTYKYKEAYDKLINEYIEKQKEDENDDQN